MLQFKYLYPGKFQYSGKMRTWTTQKMWTVQTLIMEVSQFFDILLLVVYWCNLSVANGNNELKSNIP